MAGRMSCVPRKGERSKLSSRPSENFTTMPVPESAFTVKPSPQKDAAWHELKGSEAAETSAESPHAESRNTISRGRNRKMRPARPKGASALRPRFKTMARNSAVRRQAAAMWDKSSFGARWRNKSSSSADDAASSPRNIPEARSQPSGMGRRYCSVSGSPSQGRSSALNTAKQAGA